MTLTGIIIKPDGNPYNGPVSFTPTDSPTVNGTYTVTGETITTATDAAGNLSQELVTGVYRVSIAGAIPAFITIPDGVQTLDINHAFSAGATFFTFGGGGGGGGESSSPVASPDVFGTVRTDLPSSNPVVMLAENTTSLTRHTTDLAAIANGTALNQGSIPSSKLAIDTDADKIQPTNLSDAVTAMLGAALDASKLQGGWVPASNTPAIPAAAPANSGNWYTVSTAGTASAGNAPHEAYVLGDIILSNGTTWFHKLAPVATTADSSVTRPKLAPALDAELPKFEPQSDPMAWRIVDAAGKVGLWLAPDGRVKGQFNIATPISNGLNVTRDYANGQVQVNLGTEEGVIPQGPHTLRTLDEIGIYAWQVIDSNNRIGLAIRTDGTVIGKFQVDEVVTARGVQTALTTRLDQSLTSRGFLKRHNFGEWTLRDWRLAQHRLLLGETLTAKVLLIGDSYVWNPNAIATYTSRRLKSLYGDAGTGFWSLSPQPAAQSWSEAADEADTTFTVSGTWSQPSFNGGGPDIGQTTSSVVGSKFTINLTTGKSADSLVLHYKKKNGGGMVRYRYNGGAWTSINTDNGGADAYTAETLATPPASNFTTEIEVETAGSTGVTLFGLDYQKSNAGVRVHKCGSPGSRSDQWSAIGSLWDSAIAALAPTVTIIVLGTNDQAVPTSEDAFYTNIGTIVTRLRAITPGMDIVFLAPAENLAGRLTPMTRYRDSFYHLAVDQRCGFVDGIQLFGDNTSEYDNNSPRQFFTSGDNIHPAVNGNKTYAAGLVRFLTYSS